jgi:signal transduction histidine kinase
MDPAVLRRLGEPFFTTRPFESPGLGVATARALAATLDAELTFESAPGEGTRATLELPAAAEPEAPRRRPARA